MANTFSFNASFRAAAAPLGKSLGLAGLVVCLLGPMGTIAADSKVPALSAAEIVAKNVAARGGLASWQAVQAMTWSGKLDAGGGNSAERSARLMRSASVPTNKKDLAKDASVVPKPEDDKQVQLPFTMSMARPGKSRVELEVAGKTAVQVFDGSNGWKVRPFLNRNDVEPFSATELKSEQDKGDLDGPLFNYAAKGTKVDVESVEPVEGHSAYKLKLTLKNGTVQHIWIDTQSFLDVKVEGSPRQMDGRMRTVWVYQRDFRSVQGLLIPFVYETAVDGYRDTHKMTIEKVTVNPKLSGDAFAKPRGA
jgi:outer membrane lipoprotein-sorting protein